jgi:thymidylate synthase
MSEGPILIKDMNLSLAWRHALENASETKEKEITPLLLSLTDFTEDTNIRQTVDQFLKRKKKASINTVSETIFPDSLYDEYDHDRATLFQEYLNILPRIKKIDVKNKRGTYFERLIDFEGDGNNQLEEIIKSFRKKRSVRRSKLQASIFDARRDHTNLPYQGFPCLQHITFYATKSGGLVLNSFYAIQYLFERAYGNWLGLINLGKFMANEMGLQFERFNCYIGVEQLDCLKKPDINEILRSTR